MKIARTIQIALYSVAFMVIGSLIYRAFFEGGAGRSGGFGYGNLWIRYSVEERGVLSPKVPCLIATPEMPTFQSYRGEDEQWTFSFANGKTFNLRTDSKNLVWIDPATGPTMIPADLTGEVIQRIEQTRDQARGQTFESGTGFLAWLDKTKAQQAVGGNRR